jgi:hypothetical protein
MWQFGAIVHRGGSDTTERLDPREFGWYCIGFKPPLIELTLETLAVRKESPLVLRYKSVVFMSW